MTPSVFSRINAAVQGFVAVVLDPQARSPWGYFDAFCFAENDESEGNWTSRGHQPLPGEVCAVQHHADYGGSAIFISVDAVVGP